MSNIGKAMQGMGAWFSGQGPEYEKQQILRSEMDREREEKRMAQQKQQALQMTSALREMTAKYGKEGAMQALYSMQEQADPFLAPALQEYTNLLHETGDKDLLMRELDNDFAALGGEIRGGSSGWTSSVDEKTGQAIFTNPNTGESYAKPIANYTPAQAGDDQPSIEQNRNYLTDVRGIVAKARKDFEPVEVNYRNIEGASKKPSAAGDLGIVIGYMKMLDPNSVVRETEQEMVKNAASILNLPEQSVNQLLTGETLTPEVRADVLQASKRLYKSRAIQRDAAIFDQVIYSENEGFSAEKVLGKYAGSRWKTPTYTVNTASGTEKFSLYDLYSTAQKRGKPVSQVISDLGLAEAVY